MMDRGTAHGNSGVQQDPIKPCLQLYLYVGLFSGGFHQSLLIVITKFPTNLSPARSHCQRIPAIA